MCRKKILDEAFTKNSSLSPRFLSDLDSLCERDYGRHFFSGQILCLDLDSYETSLPGENTPTMDASIGVADYSDNRTSNSRHLLVELRFDYKSERNFDMGNMLQKYNHSRSLLNSEGVSREAYFVYKSPVSAKAEYFFSRYNRQYREVQFWKAVNPESFLEEIKEKPQVYIPKTDLTELKTNLKNKFESEGIAGVIDLYGYWRYEIDKYRVRNNIQEGRAIAETVLNFLNHLPPLADQDEIEYISLLKEELNVRLN